MISGCPVKIRETAISNVRHVHPYGGQPALDIGGRPGAVGALGRMGLDALEQHVGGGEFVDDLRIPRISPEPLEPTADDSLVVLFA
jgi:hypothetical protein